MNRQELKKFLTDTYGISEIKNLYRNHKLEKEYPYIFKKIKDTTNYLSDNCKIVERLYHVMNDIYKLNKCKNSECDNITTFNSFVKGYLDFCSYKCVFKSNIGIKIETEKKCDYGCGNKANFISKNKLCCSKFYTSCPTIRKKNSIKNSLENNAMFGKKSATRYSIKDIMKKYPIFSSKEEMMENEDEIILVRCSFCNKWYIPNRNTFRTRVYCVEHNIDRQRFFCSDDCKKSSDYFRVRCDIENLKKYNEYHLLVTRKTNKNIKKYSILNIEKRGRKYSIDHKYSIRNGFDNNISADIISHIKNLEIIKCEDNSKKNKKSSISLENLIKEINIFNEEING